jgi:8-oxo-dGTP diphosphatase
VARDPRRAADRRDPAEPPRGLDPAQAWEDAALREVHEETGYRARLGAFAGALAYQVDGRPKVVRYWHMQAVHDAPDSPIDPEVSRVEWLPVEEAIRRLQYPLERALLEACGGDADRLPASR